MEIANSKQEAIDRNMTRFYHNKPCKRKHSGIWSIRLRGDGYYQIQCLNCVYEKQNNKRKITGVNLRKNRNPEKVNRELANQRNKEYEQRIKIRRKEDVKFDLQYRSKMNAKGMYRYTKKIQATPKWVNKEELRQIYLNCPVGYEVDHIIPLRGKFVSGLHVPWNLQYLTKLENLKKSNKVLIQCK